MELQHEVFVQYHEAKEGSPNSFVILGRECPLLALNLKNVMRWKRMIVQPSANDNDIASSAILSAINSAFYSAIDLYFYFASAWPTRCLQAVSKSRAVPGSQLHVLYVVRRGKNARAKSTIETM